MRRILAAILVATLAGCEGSTVNQADGPTNAAAEATSPAAPDSNATATTADSGTVHFVNTRQNALSVNLRRFYVDFSFDYPSDWIVTQPRTDGTERNFVRVVAPPAEGFEPVAVHVGLATGSGDAERDRRDIERALPSVAEQFGSSMDGYRVASVGRDRVGPYESWNWRFSAAGPAVGRRPTRMNGRGDIILPPGADRGVLIISLLTGPAGEIPTPDAVGGTGALKGVYDSFRLGGSNGR